MDETMMVAIVVGLSVAFLALLACFISRRYQTGKEMRLQKIDAFNRMIEKFGTAKEFAEFANSEGGRRLLDEPISRPTHPLTKVLRFLQAGIVFILVGIGSWVNADRLKSRTEVWYVSQMIESNHYGTLLVFLGVGLFIVGGVTYLLVRRWHLANGSGNK